MSRPDGPAVLAAVALGGAVGAVLRWALGELAPDGAGFPWTTLAVNVCGSTALAVLTVQRAVRARPVAAAALGPGLLGGFTTLSAFSEQTRTLLADGRGGLAAAYVLASLAACVGAVALAGRLAPSLTGRRPAGRTAAR